MKFISDDRHEKITAIIVLLYILSKHPEIIHEDHFQSGKNNKSIEVDQPCCKLYQPEICLPSVSNFSFSTEVWM